MVVLKGLICNRFYYEGECGGLGKGLICNSFYFWGGCGCLERTHL